MLFSMMTSCPRAHRSSAGSSNPHDLHSPHLFYHTFLLHPKLALLHSKDTMSSNCLGMPHDFLLLAWLKLCAPQRSKRSSRQHH